MDTKLDTEKQRQKVNQIEIQETEINSLKNFIKQAYLYFARPILFYNSLFYASPTIARKYFFEPQSEKDKNLNKLEAISFISGCLAGLKLLSMQYQFYNEKIKDNPKILLIPIAASAVSLAYETAREIKNIIKEIKEENRKTREKTKYKEQKTRKDLESITKDDEK